MVGGLRKLIIFWTFYLITKLPILIEGRNEVPCLFIFGDSLSDNGNNNFLITSNRANYPPYGIDYPAAPTGRFCNGKNVPDFLAEYLGFEKPVPPYATAKAAHILKAGLNYASGGAGILDQTGKYSGGVISMSRQLLNHENTILTIARSLRNASDHLNRCLYVVNIGSNDYIENYLSPPTTSLYSPPRFAAILSQQFHRQLRRLYAYGARKVAVFGLGLIGFIPAFRFNNHTDSMNKGVDEFNNNLKLLIDDLNSHLHLANFILINSTNIALHPSSHLSAGIRVSDAPCCVVSKETGLCKVGKTACTNRNEYLFFDNFHPTETANRAMATRAYHAPLPADAYPAGIRAITFF